MEVPGSWVLFAYQSVVQGMYLSEDFPGQACHASRLAPSDGSNLQRLFLSDIEFLCDPVTKWSTNLPLGWGPGESKTLPVLITIPPSIYGGRTSNVLL